MTQPAILVLSPPADSHGTNVVRDFLYGCWCSGRRLGGATMPPLNLLSIATVLRQAGLPVIFLDASVEPERFHALAAGNFSSIGAVVMLVATHSFTSDVAILASIKSRNPAIRSIICGAHPTALPESCLRHPAIDFCVCPEPEFALRDLLLSLRDGTAPDKVRGIAFRHPGGVAVTAPYPFVPLDELPIPDRTLLPAGRDYFNPLVEQMPYTTLQTSRGCQGYCSFCSVPAFYGNSVRYRSAKGVIAEISQLAGLGFRELIFRDETFTSFRERNIHICEWLIARQLNLRWIANARVDTVDAGMLQLMRRAGCHLLKFGVETGNDELLAALGKGITTAQTAAAFRLAHDAGIATHAHVMLGVPGETETTIRHTLAFVRRLKPATASFGILTAYPGTPLFASMPGAAGRDGTEADLSHLHTTAFHNTALGCSLSPDELARWVRRCYRAFYLRPSYLLRWLPALTDRHRALRLLSAGSAITTFALTGRK